jgi:hypothetical protein
MTTMPESSIKTIGMKYPYVILFRYDEHSYIDNLFEINKDKLLCSVYIINNKEDFLVFIAQIEKESLERYLSIIQP